jgi:hypothetical protein
VIDAARELSIEALVRVSLTDSWELRDYLEQAGIGQKMIRGGIWIASASTDELRDAYAFALAVGDSNVAGRVGIDVKAIEKAAMAEVLAAEKAAAKPTEPETKKPKRGKKAA